MRKKLSYNTEKQFIDITKDVADFVSGCMDDVCLVNIFSQHTTANIRIFENELLLLSDVEEFLRKAAPTDGNYRHDMVQLRDVPFTERINGYSHIRSLFFNTSENVPVENRKLLLGKWQRIFLVELDGIRDRSVILTTQQESPG